jgi:hypothetical protein
MADAYGGVLGLVPLFVKGEYRFNPNTTGVLDGSYQQLGEADGFVYLNKCGSTHIVAVNQQAITTVQQVQVASVNAPNLIDVVRGAKVPVGIPLC